MLLLGSTGRHKGTVMYANSGSPAAMHPPPLWFSQLVARHKIRAMVNVMQGPYQPVASAEASHLTISSR